MKKKISLIIGILVAIQIAFALNICEDPLKINQNCSMTTPYLSCSNYTYSILNMTGSTVETGNLTVLNESIYYFNFTKTSTLGGYVIKLCDDTTREVYVKEGSGGGDMIIGMIMLIPLIFGFFMLWGSSTLNGQEHPALKIGLFLLSFVPIFISLHMGMVSVIHFYDFPVLEEIIGSTVWYIAEIFAFIIVVFLLYLLYKMFEKSAQKKNARLRY